MPGAIGRGRGAAALLRIPILTGVGCSAAVDDDPGQADHSSLEIAPPAGGGTRIGRRDFDPDDIDGFTVDGLPAAEHEPQLRRPAARSDGDRSLQWAVENQRGLQTNRPRAFPTSVRHRHRRTP